MPLTKQAKTLTQQQIKSIFSYIQTQRYPIRNQIIFSLSIYSGLRAKEIAHLKFSEILNSNNEIDTHINLTNSTSKANSGRSIPIHPTLKSLLKIHLQHRSTFKYFNPKIDYVINTNRSTHTSAQSIVNYFYRLYKTLNYTQTSSHSGRRTFITNLAKKIHTVNGTLNDIKLLSGHSSLQTTQKYIEYDTNAINKVINLL